MSRGRLARQAAECRDLLGTDWRFMISVGAGGKSSRVVFFSGSERIVLHEDGAVAGFSTNIDGLREKLTAALRGQAKGSA